MPLQARANCQESFDLIRSWIAQCDGHPACSRQLANASSFSLPTRLIDVGSKESSAPPRLVVSVNIDLSSDYRYIALSHCWGDPATIPQTRRATFNQHEQEITNLSKTFQDAIVVTKELGIRYLWIDSLCIIQDERSDFHKQCRDMHLIYLRAYLTLSALDSVDGCGGLFIPRDPHAVENAVPIEWRDALVGPLATRGWAFQEQQLSPRLIYYSKLRLLWECRAGVAFEDVPVLRWRGFVANGPSQSATYRLMDGRPKTLIYPTKSNHALTRMDDLYTRWLRSMEIYSSRALSQISDKLPAILGLATCMNAAVPNDTYYNGIWIADFVRGLMWYRAEGVKLGNVSTETRSRLCIEGIPSWSWASFDGGIAFLCVTQRETELQNLYVLGQVVIRIAPSESDKFVGLVYEAVQLQGIIAERWIEESDCYTAQCKPEYFGIGPDFLITSIPGMEIYLDVPLVEIIGVDLQTSIKRVKLYFLKVMDCNGEPHSAFSLGLLLIKVHNGNYQRIGMWLENRLQFRRGPYGMRRHEGELQFHGATITIE